MDLGFGKGWKLRFWVLVSSRALHGPTPQLLLGGYIEVRLGLYWDYIGIMEVE